MESLDISIDAANRRLFDDEYWEWEKTRPRRAQSLGHVAMAPAMSGPFPDGRCHYVAVPKEFLEALRTKGIFFEILS
jgi:hypothetical protein